LIPCKGYKGEIKKGRKDKMEKKVKIYINAKVDTQTYAMHALQWTLI